MSRKMILLNLALLALTGIFIWQARRHYREMKAHEREVLLRNARAQAVLPPPTLAPPPAPVQPVQYIDVAQRTLFSKDRNPTVVVEAPAPKPEPPMPALPSYYGQMNIGEPVIFLSLRGADQKKYRVGDKVGEFKLISFNADTVTLGWNNKNVEKKLEDLRAKVDQPGPPGQVAGAYQAPAAAPAPGGSGVQIKSLSGASVADPAKPDSVVGSDRGDGFRGCTMNDPTADGAVVDGYRKRVVQGMMGKSCYWEKVK